MATLKCKMCGGKLTLEVGSTITTCEYCRTTQTVPAADDEKKLNLFGRANHLRFGNEFDRAYGIYEAIVGDFPEEAEAYWGLILCKYGIEYVDDPATGKKVPTCHRSSFDSVMDDPNFEMVLECSDPLSRRLYREEAKQIEELRKDILEVSSKKEPYDIFICYKETDDNNQRTIDSVIAQDVYDALTDKGYRVFFSRISLEEKLGQEYEPYIFAALNSAKVMLVFGTDYEHFNAVWVKNEWSRFLQLMTTDSGRHMIPCFKGIDAYDMPKEFAKLQAQDMGKVGAIQDLVRGVTKLHPLNEPVKETYILEAGFGITPIVERMKKHLLDEEWAEAAECAERILDRDPQNAEGYLGKLMAELKCRKVEDLEHQEKSLSENLSYGKVISLTDDTLKAQLEGYNQIILDRIADANKQAAKKKKKIVLITAPVVCAIALFVVLLITVIIPNGKYDDAVALMEAGQYREAIDAFAAIDGYKDSADMLTECELRILNEAEIYDTVFFGTYQLDDDSNNGKKPIEWVVLEKKHGKVLVISKRILDRQPFQDERLENATWETSSIRAWLNGTFITNAFRLNEEALISETTVYNYCIDGFIPAQLGGDSQTLYDMDGKPVEQVANDDTIDRVFLLSLDEVERYFASNAEWELLEADGAWLLRSQRGNGDIYLGISEIESLGCNLMDANVSTGIRPAMWIDLECGNY